MITDALKPDLMSMGLAELTEYLTREFSLPRFRAKQVFEWLNRGKSFDEMTNLPKELREKLKSEAFCSLVEIEEKYVSGVDGTIKYLFRLYDGNFIESVVMGYNHGNTICISSQAGCKMGCKFCASTKNGFVRNLLPSEMIGQILAAQKDTGLRISNVVLMGIGEPLDNYDNVMKFLRLLREPEGVQIGLRNVSLST